MFNDFFSLELNTKQYLSVTTSKSLPTLRFRVIITDVLIFFLLQTVGPQPIETDSWSLICKYARITKTVSSCFLFFAMLSNNRQTDRQTDGRTDTVPCWNSVCTNICNKCSQAILQIRAVWFGHYAKVIKVTTRHLSALRILNGCVNQILATGPVTSILNIYCDIIFKFQKFTLGK